MTSWEIREGRHAHVPRLDNRRLPSGCGGIQERMGQPKFPSAVLNAYERKCAIWVVMWRRLEAADITPFSGGR